MRKIIFFTACVIFPLIACAQDLHLYGGENHDIYLGCLTCNDFNSSSIWNEYGTFGNEYNDLSPWNEYGTNPPVVVDKEGNFYGYFTVNEYQAKRADFKLALIIYKYYDQIRKDVTLWYKNIFE